MPASSALGGDTIGAVPTSCDQYHLSLNGEDRLLESKFVSVLSTSANPVDRPQTLLVVPPNPPETGFQDEDQDLFRQHLTKEGDFQCPKRLLPIDPVGRRPS